MYKLCQCRTAPVTRVRYLRIARLLERFGILLRSASVASGTKLPVPEAVHLVRHLSPVSLTLALHRSVLALHYKATAQLLMRRRWGRAHLHQNRGEVMKGHEHEQNKDALILCRLLLSPS
jgi:hypothetical protein